MDFRIDDISIHLMPSGDKEDKADREKPGQGPRPKDEDSQGPHGQACTMATATPYTPEAQRTGNCPKKAGAVEAMALLRSQLRETLAPPPL